MLISHQDLILFLFLWGLWFGWRIAMLDMLLQWKINTTRIFLSLLFSFNSFVASTFFIFHSASPTLLFFPSLFLSFSLSFNNKKYICFRLSISSSNHRYVTNSIFSKHINILTLYCISILMINILSFSNSEKNKINYLKELFEFLFFFIFHL